MAVVQAAQQTGQRALLRRQQLPVEDALARPAEGAVVVIGQRLAHQLLDQPHRPHLLQPLEEHLDIDLGALRIRLAPPGQADVAPGKAAEFLRIHAHHQVMRDAQRLLRIDRHGHAGGHRIGQQRRAQQPRAKRRRCPGQPRQTDRAQPPQPAAQQPHRRAHQRNGHQHKEHLRLDPIAEPGQKRQPKALRRPGNGMSGRREIERDQRGGKQQRDRVGIRDRDPRIQPDQQQIQRIRRGGQPIAVRQRAHNAAEQQPCRPAQHALEDQQQEIRPIPQPQQRRRAQDPAVERHQHEVVRAHREVVAVAADVLARDHGRRALHDGLHIPVGIEVVAVDHRDLRSQEAQAHKEQRHTPPARRAQRPHAPAQQRRSQRHRRQPGGQQQHIGQRPALVGIGHPRKAQAEDQHRRHHQPEQRIRRAHRPARPSVLLCVHRSPHSRARARHAHHVAPKPVIYQVFLCRVYWQPCRVISASGISDRL